MVLVLKVKGRVQVEGSAAVAEARDRCPFRLAQQAGARDDVQCDHQTVKVEQETGNSVSEIYL